MAEVVSVVMVGAALAYRAHTVSKRHRASSLPELLDADEIHRETDIPIILVHINSAKVPNKYLGEQVKLRVKLGEPGCSAQTETDAVTVTPPPRSPAELFVAKTPSMKAQEQSKTQPLKVGFGMSCIFAGGPGNGVVRLRLMRCGFAGGVIGRTEVKVPKFANGGVKSCPMKLPIKDNLGVQSGVVEVVLEAHWVSKKEIQEALKVVCAQSQGDAYLSGKYPFASGELVEHDEEAVESFGDSYFAYGVPVVESSDSLGMSMGKTSSLSSQASMDSMASTRSGASTRSTSSVRSMASMRSSSSTWSDSSVRSRQSTQSVSSHSAASSPSQSSN
eukprot:TRINITY_DN5312_c0_g1_i4.p1 TRINITY_DN5312_c0_g1~~TRINITY_DN5312_c0_g1_i4.p1  ORF type:complete len:332 (-),score=62.89 TRINITY_DN5312_c0_g1_i4:260-1255(-)